MNTRDLIPLTGLGLLAAAMLAVGKANEDAAPAKTAGRPNILLIVADDMGFSDAGCYGGGESQQIP